MKNLIKKILKESEFDWVPDEPQLTWGLLQQDYKTIVLGRDDVVNVGDLFKRPKGNVVYKITKITRYARTWPSDARYELTNTHSGVKTHKWSGELKSSSNDSRGSIPNFLSIIPKNINESDFEWADIADVSPNYEGHPQGVVHLRDHDEIDEYMDLIIKYNDGEEFTKAHRKDYHIALEDARDNHEAGETYGDWIPTISASFFMSKDNPTKYDTGYWDYDVQEDSVQDWLDDRGCEEEVIDCENWKIYTDISQVRGLLSSKLVESNDFDWTEEADVRWSTYYDEIYKDVASLPGRVDDVDMETLMLLYYKLDVLTREIKKGSNLKDTSVVDDIHWNVEHIINMINGTTMKHQAQYGKVKDYILGNIRKLTNQLRLVNESNDFEWTDIDPNILHKPYVGMKFKTKNHPSVFEVIDLSGSMVYYKWGDGKSSIPIPYFKKYMENGDWVTYYVNESNDFEWAEETPIPPIHVGGKLRTPNGNILTITKVDYKRKLSGVVQMVRWKVFHDGSWGEASDRYWDVEKRIEDGVWDPVSDETINESNDFDWVEDVPNEFTPEMLRYGQKFSDEWGEHTRVLMFVGMDDMEVCYEPPCSLLRFHIIDNPSGYKPYPMLPDDDEQNIGLDFNPNEFVRNLKRGKIKPLIDDDFKFLDESNDFDWVSEVGSDREQILDDLEARISSLGWDVDLERDYDCSADGFGCFFGRFWCGRGENEQLHELYEYDGKFSITAHSKSVTYSGDMEYFQTDIYNNLTSEGLMSKITKIIVKCLDNKN